MTTQTATADTKVAVAPLTADDVKALRQAHDVSLHFREGRGYLQATMQKDTYTAAQQRIFPDVGRSMGGERSREVSAKPVAGDYSDGRPVTSAFAYIPVAQYSSVWRTVAGLLKVGDVLSLVFRGNAHTNEYLRDAGLHGDVAFLVVNRGSQQMTFMVNSQVSPDNSARMVRR